MKKTNDFAEVLNGRHSVRVYDETVKIPHDEMLAMLDEAATAPSALNLQPWHFVVVDSPAGKEKLRPFMRFNVSQAETASALVIVFGDLKSYTNVEKIYGEAVATGKMPQETADHQVAMVQKNYASAPLEKLSAAARFDTGLVSMQLMLVARAYGYDTNPIGGFAADNLATTFDLDETRYVPMLVIAMGVRKDAANLPASVRLPAAEITDFK